MPTAPPAVRLPHCPLTSSAGADSLPPLPRPPHRPPPRLASNSAGVPPGYRGQPPAYSLSSPLPLLSPATSSTSTWVALEPCPMQQSMCWSCQSHERHPRDPCAAPPPRSAERERGHFGEQLPRLQVNAMPAQAAAPSMTSSGCAIPPRLQCPLPATSVASTTSKVFDKISSS